MQIHEQIYTSASELLAPSQSDLGVVAESVGFPSRLASQLTVIASYRMLQGLPADDPKMHPSRIVAMPRNGGTSYSVSRIVYAGADHSGRTTPLAHHVLIALDDLAPNRISLGETIRALNNLYFDYWNQKPQIFDPPRSIDVTLPQGSIHSIGEAKPQRLANVLGWLAGRFVDGLGANSPPVVFVLPTEQRDESLKLLGAIHQSLAPAKQSSLIFQSHVSSPADLVGHAHVVATYPGSEYLNVIQSWPEKRRPTVIDFSAPSSSTFNNVGFASWIEGKLNENDTLQTIQKGLRLRESLSDIDESRYPDGFSQVWRFYESINTSSMITHIDDIGKQSETLSSISPNVAGFVVKWTNAAINDHVKKKRNDSNWRSLLQILVSNSWPKPARKLCLDLITEMPEFSFPIALANREAMQIPELAEKISETIQEKPVTWKKMLQGPPQQAECCRLYLESQVGSGKLALEAAKSAIQILIEAGNLDQKQQAVRVFLTSPILERPIPVKLFEWLQLIEPEKGLLQRVLGSANLPPQIAESLESFLHPSPPSNPETPESTSSQGNAAFEIPRKQNSAPSTFINRCNNSRAFPIRDPRPLIRNTSAIVGLLVISGIAVVVWGKFRPIYQISTIMFWSAVAAVFISLITACTAYFCFSKNRIVSRQRPLMFFCFISVAFMIASATAVLGSFLAPFFQEVFFRA